MKIPRSLAGEVNETEFRRVLFIVSAGVAFVVVSAVALSLIT